MNGKARYAEVMGEVGVTGGAPYAAPTAEKLLALLVAELRRTQELIGELHDTVASIERKVVR